MMVVDILLRLLGDDPAQYPNLDHKLGALGGDILFYGTPIALILLFFLPLIVIRVRQKKFTVLNVAAAIGLGFLLVLAGMFLVYLGIMVLHGLAVRDLYGS